MRGSEGMLEMAPIAAYVFLTLAGTCLAAVSKSTLLAVACQAFPMLFALLAWLVFPGRRERFKSFGVSRLGTLRGYVAALIPIVPIAVSYLAAWALGLVNLPDLPASMTHWQRLGFLAGSYLAWWLPLPFLWALGEELGWRGFLQPLLTRRLGPRKAFVLTGLIWAVWHYNFIFGLGYYTAGNLWIDAALFTATLIPMSIVLGELRMKTGSLWPAVLFHGWSNLCWQFFNVLFYVKQPGWVYVAGEAGLINLLVWTLLAWRVWRRLPPSTPTQRIQGSHGGGGA